MSYRVVVGTKLFTISGIAVFAANLVQGLARRGVAAEVLEACHDGPNPDPLPAPEDVAVRQLPLPAKRDFRSRARALVDYLEERAPCVYIPNNDFAHSIAIPVLSNRVAVVGVVNNDQDVEYEQVARLGRYMNAIATVSSQISREVRRRHPELADRVELIRYGVPVPREVPARTKNTDDPIRIVWAGRIEQRVKRILDVAAIARRLAENGVPFHLTIAGEGIAREAFAGQVRDLIGAGVVEITGTISNEDVRRRFAASDVFLLTSVHEGLPLSLTEAMAHGCVPVVTDIPSGHPDVVVPGETGYLVPVGDVDAFAGRIGHLQNDPALCARFATAAREKVLSEGCDVDTMAGRYTALFEKAFREIEDGAFRRPRGSIRRPPGDPGPIARTVNRAVAWFRKRGAGIR